MDWTVLRPTQFASNAVMWAASIRGREAVRAPFADTGLPTIHPADVASVARMALTEPGHRGQTYALTGPETVTARQQVEAIAAAIGRDVPFVEISRGEARAPMAAVFGEEAADAVLDVTGGDVNDELLTVRDTRAGPLRVVDREASALSCSAVGGGTDTHGFRQPRRGWTLRVRPALDAVRRPRRGQPAQPLVDRAVRSTSFPGRSAGGRISAVRRRDRSRVWPRRWSPGHVRRSPCPSTRRTSPCPS